MELSSTKREILEALLLHFKPAKAALIARETGKDAKAVQMHLIGLTRTGHAASPEKGSYIITEQGKMALGLPEVTKERAKKILAAASSNKAFHFYTAIGKPLTIYAHDLLEFRNKISGVDLGSVEFHLHRGDFEAWFLDLGDVELVKKTALLKQKGPKGEELRDKFQEIVDDRCMTLSRIAG